MDDLTELERRLTEELDEMAGPGRDVDALAMTRAVAARSTRRTLRPMFSATKVVLAGGLAALIVASLVIGGRPQPAQELIPAASASPSPPATVLPGLVTEEVEPGVLRVVRDDAGHDLDMRYPDWRYDLDDMTITPDGTVWVRSTYHDSDNDVGVPQGPLVWALGRPGALGVADGIPPSVRGLVPLPDSSVLAIGDDEIARVDGTSVIPDDGRPVRPVHGGELWFIGPEALAQLSGGDTPDGRIAMLWDGGTWITVDEMGRTAVSPTEWCQATLQGVACDARLYLEGTRVNKVATAPDGAIWAVGSLEGEGGGLYRIAPR